jgi:hypothetical protein
LSNWQKIIIPERCNTPVSHATPPKNVATHTVFVRQFLYQDIMFATVAGLKRALKAPPWLIRITLSTIFNHSNNKYLPPGGNANKVEKCRQGHSKGHQRSTLLPMRLLRGPDPELRVRARSTPNQLGLLPIHLARGHLGIAEAQHGRL